MNQGESDPTQDLPSEADFIIREALEWEFKELGQLMVAVYSSLEGFPSPEQQPTYYQMLTNIGQITGKPGTKLLVAVAGNKLVGGVVFFSAIIGVCYSHSFFLSQCVLLFEGYSAILMISSFNVAIQHLASDQMRGRVMSIYATSFLGLPPLGSLLAGELSRHVPTPHALAGMAAIAAVIFLGTYGVSGALRGLD